MSDLERDFLDVADLCFALEQVAPHPAVVRRLASAFSRGVEKALIVGWYQTTIPDVTATNLSILRAAERGARG